jgi:hypothetical protein
MSSRQNIRAKGFVLETGGRALGSTEFRIRRANPTQAAEIQIALTGELARREYEGYVFVFFVPVDAELQ